MNKTTIYIATHKMFSPPKNSIYVPIVAGANQNHLPFLKDNTGENISDKNPYYSELTALYWIWKHDKSKYVGFTHYHRYFYRDTFISKKEIKELLKRYDLIVPSPLLLDNTVFLQYASVHYKNDLLLACKEIEKQDFTYHATIKEILNQNKLYTCNMFISSKEVLNDYLSFLFPILFSLEEQIPYLSYSLYNQRVFGFLAERIFNIYLRKNKLAFYEYPVFENTSSLEQAAKIDFILNSLEVDKRNGR